MPKSKSISIVKAAFNPSRVLITIALVSVFSCLDPFNPAVLNGDSMLVVDGLVDTDTHTATVRLTRTKNLRDEDEAKPETEASVDVRNERGEVFNLDESSPGIYRVGDVPLNNGDKCSLHIVLQNGMEYRSDEVELKFSPPIDSLNYSTDNNGVEILVTTHDDSNNSRYYKWTYLETWEYTAVNFSQLKIADGLIVNRHPSEVVYRCWRDAPSPKISVANTSRLQRDVVFAYPMTGITKGSQKISVRYSVNVVQRVISKEEYEYVTQLIKTSESLGGLFDPLPAPTSGNIRSISGQRQPIGYFSGGSSDTKRTFVDWVNLPDVLRVRQSRIGCQPDTIPAGLAASIITPSDYIIDAIYKNSGLCCYTISTDVCSDCRLQGGTTTRPPYW